jgi:hypothetical protein
MMATSLFIKQEDILDALRRCKEEHNIIGITLPTAVEMLLVTVAEIEPDAYHLANTKIIFRDYDLHGKLLAFNNCLLDRIKTLTWFDSAFDAPVFLKFRSTVFRNKYGYDPH